MGLIFSLWSTDKATDNEDSRPKGNQINQNVSHSNVIRRRGTEERRLQRQGALRKRRESRRQRLSLEIDNDSELLQRRHEEILQQLRELDLEDQQRYAHAEQDQQLAHQRRLEGQDKLYSIYKETFSKVKEVDSQQAVQVACVLYSVQGKNPANKSNLKGVPSKGNSVLGISQQVNTREVEE